MPYILIETKLTYAGPNYLPGPKVGCYCWRNIACLINTLHVYPAGIIYLSKAFRIHNYRRM